MKNIHKYLLIFLLTVTFSWSGFYQPGVPDLGQTVSIAEAHHKPGHRPKPCKGKKCRPPPTVSELPIEYMIPLGFALIMLSGGVVYLKQKRNRENSPEA